MTPYFEQDGVTLYHGDCRDILPQLGQFDLLLTDPPYGINENTTKQQSRQGHGLASQKNYGTYDWDQSTCPDALGAAMAACGVPDHIWRELLRSSAVVVLAGLG